MFEDDGSDFPRKKTVPLDSMSLPPGEVDVSLYSQTELLILRNKIDARLPPMQMASMNLEEEVVLQFMTVKALQADTLAGNNESNQKAAVVNACASALKALVNMQVEIHTAERFKKIENLMVRYIKRLPKDTAEQFLKDYSNLVDG